jgi:hypothetical protein
MLQKIIWSNQTDIGLEHFYLQRGEEEITADGIVIGVEEHVAFRIRYQINCDLRWHVRKVMVTSLDAQEQIIQFVSDGFGIWTGWLSGCGYYRNAIYEHAPDSAIESGSWRVCRDQGCLLYYS